MRTDRQAVMTKQVVVFRTLCFSERTHKRDKLYTISVLKNRSSVEHCASQLVVNTSTSTLCVREHRRKFTKSNYGNSSRRVVQKLLLFAYFSRLVCFSFGLCYFHFSSKAISSRPSVSEPKVLP